MIILKELINASRKAIKPATGAQDVAAIQQVSTDQAGGGVGGQQLRGGGHRCLYQGVGCKKGESYFAFWWKIIFQNRK